MSKKGIFIIIIAVFVISIFLSFSAFIFGPKVEEGGNIRSDIGERQKAIETEVLTGGEETEEREESIEGIIRRLEASIYMEGTHYLEVDGVILILLESTHNINLDKYVGKNVEIEGELRMTIEGDSMIMDVEKIKIVK